MIDRLKSDCIENTFDIWYKITKQFHNVMHKNHEIEY